MKKIFLIIGLISMFSSLSAQIDFSSTRYGVTVGGTYSGVSNAHNPSGKRTSVYGGFIALIPVDSNNQFFIQPEVEYWGAGETGDKKVQSPNGLYADNYISVPLFFKGYFSEAESEFFALAGPQFNFLISQKVKNPSKTYYTPEGDPAYPGVNGKASSFNLGIAVGAGFSYKRQLELTARFDFGLSNTYKNLMYEPGKDTNIGKRKTTQVLSVGLSYIFQ